MAEGIVKFYSIGICLWRQTGADDTDSKAVCYSVKPRERSSRIIADFSFKIKAFRNKSNPCKSANSEAVRVIRACLPPKAGSNATIQKMW
jgi:hypothetical protein